jgi:hypothetical protein
MSYVQDRLPGITICYNTGMLTHVAGAVWECPLVAALPPLPHARQQVPSHTLGLGQRRSVTQLVSEDGGNGDEQQVKGLVDDR